MVDWNVLITYMIAVSYAISIITGITLVVLVCVMLRRTKKILQSMKKIEFFSEQENESLKKIQELAG